MKRIYFDSAATSWPKPRQVVKAVSDSFGEYGGNPGRSAHSLSMNASLAVYGCRERVCSFVGCRDVENVVFTYNATYALNAAVKGLVSKGDHILFSNLEHNSVIRPIHALSLIPGMGVTYGVFDATGDDDEILDSFSSMILPQTRLAVITLASNVCGRVLPVKAISEVCKLHGITLIADGAQGAGSIPVHLERDGIDVLCLAGHKSLYGPQGVGVIVFGRGISPRAVIEGGNGVNSSSRLMDDSPLPERLEAGTLSVPCIRGLAAGIDYVDSVGADYIRERGLYLSNILVSGLSVIRGVSVYGDCTNRTPCICFNKAGISSEKMAQYLAENNVCVRSGFHCAPIAHKALGTGEYGAVRVSMSFGNTKKETDTLLSLVSKAQAVHSA